MSIATAYDKSCGAGRPEISKVLVDGSHRFSTLLLLTLCTTLRILFLAHRLSLMSFVILVSIAHSSSLRSNQSFAMFLTPFRFGLHSGVLEVELYLTR